MPHLEYSDFSPPLFLQNGHVQTIVPSLLRKVNSVVYQRQRIATPDDDFLDLDWCRRRGGKRLAILSHGLEGDTSRSYMRGMAAALFSAGWQVLAWNFRGCSGEPNRKLPYYHSGATGDLHTVITHALEEGSYEEIVLIGFSLGGNMTLKYLGERGGDLPGAIRKAVAFSVPCDLAASSRKMARRENWPYMVRFLRALHIKIRWKMAMFPGQIDDHDYRKMRTFQDFDDRYTAPLNGFRDAADYWRQCSSRQFLPAIRIPTLLVNAANDPFLSAECYPREEAAESPFLHLEIPASGGHVGFMPGDRRGYYWSERRAIAFLGDA